MKKIAQFISSPKGSKLVLIIWIIAIVLLSVIAPGSKEYSKSSGEGSIHNNTPSAEAQKVLDQYFPTKDGLVALLVFHGEKAFTDTERAKIIKFSKWLSSKDKPKNVTAALPFHQFSKDIQDKLFSNDKKTLLLNVAMKKNLESDQIYDTLQEIRKYVEKMNFGSMKFEITGPAGIASDTITLFKNADFILLFATIGLILIILIIIYRSPLLAVIPLVIAGMVYQVVDRILGLAGKYHWFVVEKQALSIMMILLFAILTDYSLFILSRFKEELSNNHSKYVAMKNASVQLIKPILFSGGTVLIAMLVLFLAIFKPYHHFAPVFSVAMIVILFGGITLIPAIFTLVGRKAFWPFIPKIGEKTTNRIGIWSNVGKFVTKKPGTTAGILLTVLIFSAFNVGSMKYSFNIMKSFPSNISSRQGFALLEESYPQGQLAPVSVILKSDQFIQVDSAFVKKFRTLTNLIKQEDGINEITPMMTNGMMEGESLPRNFLSIKKDAIKFQLVLQDHPYDQSALNVLNNLRENSNSYLKESGFDSQKFSIYFAGQTAEQLDVKNLNQRDTIIIFILISVLITIMLIFQSRRVGIALMMMGTMLLSYVATLGLGWMIFHHILGFESISYRLPVYTFVFLIALGVDYNIILVSRIMEEAKKYPWNEAVARGVSLTGGVISSAGIILAATFCVLISQPLQELFLFGITMAMGILIDTFLVRGMLLPSLLSFFNRKNLIKITSNYEENNL